MSTDKTTKHTCEDCDDPCDDCTELEMGNLSGWIETKEKLLDKPEES